MKLKEVDDLGINGIIVGDIAALTYDLKTNIILDQMHLNNSFYAINHYYNNGVYGTVLTNDITLATYLFIFITQNILLYIKIHFI